MSRSCHVFWFLHSSRRASLVLCVKVGSRIWEAESQSFRKKWSRAKSSVSAAGRQREPTCTQASALQPGPRRAGTGNRMLRAASPSPGEVAPRAALPVPRCRLVERLWVHVRGRTACGQALGGGGRGGKGEEGPGSSWAHGSLQVSPETALVRGHCMLSPLGLSGSPPWR